MADDTPPPIAPCDHIPMSDCTGNASAIPASGTTPNRPTNQASAMAASVYAVTCAATGSASTISVGPTGPSSMRLRRCSFFAATGAVIVVVA